MTFAGIDLGTTFSCIAILDDSGRPITVPAPTGARLTPSVVAIPNRAADDAFAIGDDALAAADANGQRVVTTIKRHIGDQEFRVYVGDDALNATELSKMILARLADQCRSAGHVVDDVVITVPSFYDETRRSCVMQAGEQAGLRVLGIINEPTAAALYYATAHAASGRVLVYDLGGGTFDVTLLDIMGRDVEILCSHGDHHLGGVDFDAAILSAMRATYEAEHGTALVVDRDGENRVRRLAEDVKRTLSSEEHAELVLDGPSGPCTFSMTREQFEEAILEHLLRTEFLIDLALGEARTSRDQVDVVLLVGGSSRIPLVASRLEAYFGFAPTVAVDVDECVAQGAALHAGMLLAREEPERLSNAQRDALGGVSMTDVCNHSYGTICMDVDPITGRHVERNSIIIPKNTPLPCSRVQTYYTAGDGQTEANCRITQGEDGDPAFVNILASPTLELPPGRRAGKKLQFTYSYDRNQRMHCTFLDVESGAKVEIEIGGDAGSQSPDILTPRLIIE